MANELYGFKRNLEKVQVRSKSDSAAKSHIVPVLIDSTPLASPSVLAQYAEKTIPELANWNVVALVCSCGAVRHNLIFFRDHTDPVYLVDSTRTPDFRGGYHVAWSTNKIRVRYMAGDASLAAEYVQIQKVYGLVKNVNVDDESSEPEPDEGDDDIDISALTEEVLGIRIGYDGTIYETAGQAVREQYRLLAEQLEVLDVTQTAQEITELIESVDDAVATAIAQIEESGGLILDSTLTQSGQAADAKVVGDAIEEVRESLSTTLPTLSKSQEAAFIEETVIDFPNVGVIGDTSGNLIPTQTAYLTTDFIPLDNVTAIYRTGTTTKFTLWRYAFYDANKACLGIVADTEDYEIESYNGKQVTWLTLSTYPTAKYIRISRIPYGSARPYIYYKVTSTAVYKYNVPHITIDNIEPLKFVGKKIVNFGDSIFGNFRDTNDITDKSISKMIADATGATVYNCGFGGCRMGYHSQYWRAFSMYALADAIATNTWNDQDAAIAAQVSGMPAYFADTLALLKSIDFDEIDYITIGYGTNDYAGNAFIDYASGLEEYQYFKGALEYSIRKILTAFPHIRIIVISPCWRWFLENGIYAYSSDDEQSKNTRNLMLPDYVDACKVVCNKLHIPYIDTYYTLGFNEYTHIQYFPASDGTHPNQNGRQLRADRIIGQMEAFF